jgi:hypothetical protein
MSESTLNSATFPQTDALGADSERLPVGMAVLTIFGASSLLWLGLYAGFQYLVGA